MKEKDGSNAEDILAQLNNSRTSETVLKALYSKLNSANMSNVQRVRLLKIVILHCSKNGSTDLRIAALSAGLSAVQFDFCTSVNPASGAAFALLDGCVRIVMNYVQNSNSQHIDVVVKAMEILSIVNSATVSKLFCDESSATFMKIVSTCLKINKLTLHTLKLLAVGLSAPKSEAIAEAISKDKIVLIQLVFPLIFNPGEADVQRIALQIMQELKLSTKPQPFWNQLKEDTQNVHCKRLLEMVNNKENWPEVWQFVVNMFGEELHSGGQLINHMLEVLERAFKHTDFEWTRVQAFECWNTLIENFKSGLKNRKRIDLIMIPLKANNHRIETLAVAKLKTYDHLLKTLGDDLSSSDIILNLLSFCFGSEKTTCSPVKSYPALHVRCAEHLKDIVTSPSSLNFFTKAHKELINAVGDCFVMVNVPSDLLTQIWNGLLALIQKQEGTDIMKALLSMVNNLVMHAGGNGELTGNLKVRRNMSPPSTPTTSEQPNEVLGRKIVLIILHGLVLGKSALKRDLFMCRSLYVGSYDVMNGTPSLLFIEWLLSPALALGAGDSDDYIQLFAKLISFRREELIGFMDFTQLILKKFLIFDDCLNSNKKTLMHKYVTHVWCTLAEELVQFICSQGSINQGDAAEHDFRALYAVLMYPSQNLHFDFGCIEMCRQPWSNLFYEACQQAELVPTSSLQCLCEQLCIRLHGFGKRSSAVNQQASVYLFLTCILEVASSKFKSKKSSHWVQLHISGIIKELTGRVIDQEVIFSQIVSCVQQCLQLNSVTIEVVNNVSPTLSSLLKSKFNTYDHVDKLCTLLGALKRASLFIHQHGSTKETVTSMLQNVINAAKSHTSQKVKSTIEELCDAFMEKKLDNDKAPTENSSTFSPNNPARFSPKPASKKLPTVLMSPSSICAGGMKRKMQTAVCGSDGKFVRIETPPKKIILTEHQKEVRRERRQDIPALYQDLSQDTQSMSQDVTQDFTPLPVTPKGKSSIVLDENAVLDVVDVDSSIQVLCIKAAESPRCTREGQLSADIKTELSSFTPPAGFVLPSVANKCVPIPETENANQEQTSDFKQEHLGKENDVSSASKLGKSNKAPRAITRSSFSTNSKTRSGKIIKRNSMALEMDLSKLKKSARKSLQLNYSEDLIKKSAIEPIVIESDTTDTESISSLNSDVSGTNSKSKTTVSSRTSRSLKKEVSVESDTEVAIVVEKKTENDGESMIKCTDDLPLAKVFNVKILTRSRSNSSLDEVVALGKKAKNLSPDSKDKVAGSTKEPNKLSSPEKTYRKSPRKSDASTMKGNAVKLTQVSPPGENGSDELTCDTPAQHSAMERIFCSGVSKNVLSSPNGTNSPQSNEKVENISPEGLLSENDKPGEEIGKEESSIPASELDGKAESASCSDTYESTECAHDIDESQEIIESSQEPTIKLKQCLVSLEQFQCTEPNEKVEIASVVVEKGPDASSPYKVHPKATSDVPPVKQNALCRRSLTLDVAEKSQRASASFSSSPPKTRAVDNRNSKSPICDKETTSKNQKSTDVSRKISVCNDNKGILKMIHNKAENKEQDSSSTGEVIPQSRTDSMPEWMHDKKNSPVNKTSRTIRSASARSQAFMKSVTDVGASSSPPKGVDVSPVSSPVQSKKVHKITTDASSTPIIKRSSRAAQLLGLGQAAAARGGETVVSNASRPARLDKANEFEESEANNTNSVSSTSVGSSSSNSGVTNTLLNTISTTVGVSSPSVRRQGRLLDLDSLKSTPQKCLEDKGVKEDWVPKDPHAKATPDSSILKRKREMEVDVPSPNLKRKRVSFRDPPLSSMLRFGETTEQPGTVFSSDQSTGSERIAEVINIDCETEDCNKIGEITEIQDEVCVSEPSPSADTDAHVNGRSSPGEKKMTRQPSEIPANEHQMTISPKKSDLVAQVEDVSDLNNVQKKTIAENNITIDKAKEVKQVNSEPSPEICDCEMDINLEKSQGCSEESEVESQSMLDDLHQTPSSLSPIYANLLDCTHSVECISSKLTSGAWEKSLLQDLHKVKIHTVGDLAKLTEEQLDRLQVKQPKRTNVFCVLEDFEKLHSNLMDGVDCHLSKRCKTSPHSSQSRLEDILASSSQEEIMKALTKLGKKSEFCQAAIHSLQPKEVINSLKLEDVLNSLEPENVINSFRPKVVATVIESNHGILKSLPADVGAEIYISQVGKSSGKKEKTMSVEDLSAILNRVPGGIIRDTMFPSIPSILSSVYTDMMCAYVLRECNTTEILQNLGCTKAEEFAVKLIPKLSPSVFVQNLNAINLEKYAVELLPKLSASVLAQEIDSAKAKELANMLLSKMSPSDIAQLINVEKCEETMKALLSKFNVKNSLEFLLKHSLNVVKELD